MTATPTDPEVEATARDWIRRTDALRTFVAVLDGPNDDTRRDRLPAAREAAIDALDALEPPRQPSVVMNITSGPEPAPRLVPVRVSRCPRCGA